VDAGALFRHLAEEAERTGVRAVHLVDEAAPPASLLRLALLNREAGLSGRAPPLVFWGNIRFEEAFTPDAAAILASGGLLGISAGIEVASEAGLKRLGKGVGLGEIVRSCAAFKEAGILTHAYLIYGYWDETEQEILDSAEIVRQLFAEGLLDSAFWHKFVLTCHSGLYAQWRRGRRRGLEVSRESGGTPVFARNDLHFAGEERFDKYTAPLDALLALWMKGGAGSPLEQAFPFAVPRPAAPPDLVRRLLDEYARDRDKDRARKKAGESGGGSVIFLGSAPGLAGEGKTKSPSLFWRWRMRDHRLVSSSAAEAEKLAALITEASRCSGFGEEDFFNALVTIAGEDRAAWIWKSLRRGGLAKFPLGGVGLGL
jgi:hypothetical protein